MKRLGSFALAALLLAFPEIAHACPTCGDAVADGAGGAGLIRGFYWGVLLLLFLPAGIVEAAAFAIWRHGRVGARACRNAQASPAETKGE